MEKEPTAEETKEHRAEMLRQLVLLHKRACDTEDCGISTYMIYDSFYKPFLGEKAAEHFKDFI